MSLLLLVFFPGIASAGDYHQDLTLDCGECHVMHPKAASEPRLQLGDPGASTMVVGLLARDINDLCLSCHDNSPRATDVMGRNLGHGPGTLRQAGFLNRLGRTGNPGTGHTLDSLAPAPGSSPPWEPVDARGEATGLNCVHCHLPHGGQNGLNPYRNLRPDAGHNRGLEGLVTYNDRPGLNDLGRDVFVRRALDYDESAVDFNEPDPKGSAMASFCAGCHNEFHGPPGDDRTVGGQAVGSAYHRFQRHPTSGVDIGKAGGRLSSLAQFASRQNRVKVMSAAGSWATPGPDSTPSCFSCHKAHGNSNPFGLIYRSGEGLPTEDGDTRGTAAEDLCNQCHVQQTAFSKP